MPGFWNRKSALTPSQKPADTPLPEANGSIQCPDKVVTVNATKQLPPSHPPIRQGWHRRLAGSGFAQALITLFSRHEQPDEALVDNLEALLISADVGVKNSTQLIDELRKGMRQRQIADTDALLTALRQALLCQLRPVEKPLDIGTHRPFVILTVGVNGVGKTTTIGKLAYHYTNEGHHVLLAAGDTFRAAAVEQLRIWGMKNKVSVIAQDQNADSASVIFDAMQAARARDVSMLIADTAGRLHTDNGLMEELAKINRVLKKIDSEAPHEILMVIDGTTGQNAISQLRQFCQWIPVTGLVITKLDGTAKGGVVFALAREFGLPIRYIGLGEGVADLTGFNAETFVDSLLPASQTM